MPDISVLNVSHFHMDDTKRASEKYYTHDMGMLECKFTGFFRKSIPFLR